MPIPLESKEEQLAVIEANAEQIGAIAHKGYATTQEKGTVIIFRQNENGDPTLEEWQLRYRPMSQIESFMSDWKASGLQDILVRYNPDVSVVCTLLYPNGAHASYHIGIEPE